MRQDRERKAKEEENRVVCDAESHSAQAVHAPDRQTGY